MKRCRIVAALLACIMAALIIPFAALAEGEGAGIALSVSGGNQTLAPGDQLSVNVKFDSAVADFGGALFNVEYDSTALEFVSYTALLGTAADEAELGSASGEGMLNYGGAKVAGKVKLLLLNSDPIISGGNTGIAAGTVIGNIVFRVKGASGSTAEYGIASADFSANTSDDAVTELTPAASTFAKHTLSISSSAEYPTENAPDVYVYTTERADGLIALNIKANGLKKVQRLELTLKLNGYTGFSLAEGSPFDTSSVTIDSASKTVTINYSGEGIDLSSGKTFLTMQAEADAEQSIAATPKAIASVDAKGELSPTTKPNIVDDPYGGYELGDVNGDGSIDVTDGAFVFQYIVGITKFDDMQKVRADVDGNGMIDVTDAALIMQYVVGIVTNFR